MIISDFSLNEGDIFSLDKLLPFLGIHAGMKQNSFMHNGPMQMQMQKSHGKPGVTYKIHTVPLMSVPSGSAQNEIHKYPSDQPKLYSFYKPEVKLPMTYPPKPWASTINDYHFIRPTEEFYVGKEGNNEYHDFKPPVQINPFPINSIPLNALPINPSSVPHSVQSFSIHPSPVSQYQNPTITKSYYVPKTINTYKEDNVNQQSNYQNKYHGQANEQVLSIVTQPQQIEYFMPKEQEFKEFEKNPTTEGSNVKSVSESTDPTYTSRYETNNYSTERSNSLNKGNTNTQKKHFHQKNANRQKYKTHKFSSSFLESQDQLPGQQNVQPQHHEVDIHHHEEQPNYPRHTHHDRQSTQNKEYENYHMNFELKKAEVPQALPMPQPYFQPPMSLDVRPVFEAPFEGPFAPIPYASNDNIHIEVDPIAHSASNDAPQQQVFEDITYAASSSTTFEVTTETPKITTYKNSYYVTHPTAGNVTEESIGSADVTTERQKANGIAVADSTCERRCIRNTTKQIYEPVCGSDGKSYTNKGKLRCAQSCGKSGE
jgi:hypothetical protein